MWTQQLIHLACTQLLACTQRFSYICWMEKNPDSHHLKVLVCNAYLFTFVFRIQQIYYFIGKCPKGIRKTSKNLFFAFIINFTWILSTLATLPHYLLQLQISDETNKHSQDTLCSYMKQNRQFHFLGQILPKNGFKFWNSEK